MTCKDCYHCGICNKKSLELEIENKNNSVDLYCLEFKDSSKIIELPCKVGDILYVVHDDSVWASTVKRFYQSFCGTWKIAFVGGDMIDIAFNTIGKTVFLTKEAAEQALRESNA